MSTENNTENSGTPEKPHKSWLGEIIEKIEHKIEGIDTDFPLSGAETDEDLDESIESIEDDINEEVDKIKDTDFPLSGGEDQ